MMILNKIYLNSLLMKTIVNQEKPMMLLMVIILNMKVKEIKTKLYQLKNLSNIINDKKNSRKMESSFRQYNNWL